MDIYISKNGQQEGPISVEQARRRAQAGELAPTDLGWYPGCVNWIPLSGMPGVFDEEEDENEGENENENEDGNEAPSGAKPTPQTPQTSTEPPLSPVSSQTSQERQPWLRLGARMIDFILCSQILGIFIGLLAPGQIPEANQVLSLVSLAFFMLLEPWVITRYGTTPGKKLLNIRVLTRDGEKPSLRQAYKRSLMIWVFGLGLGLPLVSLVAMIFSYFRLIKTGTLWWDEQAETRVIHGEVSSTRITLAALFIAGVLILSFILLMQSGAIAT